MGQILGLGLTHSPPLLSASGDTASRIKRMMGDPLLPEQYRSPATWPEPMRQQWGNDEARHMPGSMLGAMAELGRRKPQEARFVESWLTNANKVFAVFRP